MSTLAIITARGGSKRIPRKNIKEFCGKPIIAYSIEAAIGSGIFDEVMVSTDDEEISKIALSYGAKVPFLRSQEQSGDYATTSDVLLEVLDEYEKKGQSFDIGCCIYPTAPFITSDKLKEAGIKFKESDADSLVPVVPFSYPPQRCFVIRENMLSFKYPEYLNTRSQDLEKEYHDAGQFYFFRTKNFKESGNLLLGKVLPMVIDEMEVQDIDNLTDWQIAELKYKLMIDKTRI